MQCAHHYSKNIRLYVRLRRQKTVNFAASTLNLSLCQLVNSTPVYILIPFAFLLSFSFLGNNDFTGCFTGTSFSIRLVSLDAANANYNARFELEQLKDVHFSKNKLSDTSKGDRQFDYIFTLLAIFILIILS